MLRCSDGSLYVGITGNYLARLTQHQAGADPTAYTFSRRPVKLVYRQNFTDVHEAITWEKRLKKWSHQKKQALANGDYERLPELARKKFSD